MATVNPTVEDIDEIYDPGEIADLLTWASIIDHRSPIIATVRLQPRAQHTMAGIPTRIRTYGIVTADHGERGRQAPALSVVLRRDHIETPHFKHGGGADGAFFIIDPGFGRVVIARIDPDAPETTVDAVTVVELRPDTADRPAMLAPDTAYHMVLRRPLPGSRGAEFNEGRKSDFLVNLAPDA